MSRIWRGAGVALLVLGFGGAAAAAELNAAKVFGERDEVRQASLSPDGKRIGLIQPLAEPQAYALYVATVDGDAPARPILTSNGKNEQIRRCGWVSNTRLICDVEIVVNRATSLVGYGRIISIDADGSRLQVLSAKVADDSYTLGQNGGSVVDWLADDDGAAVLMTRAFAEQYGTGTLLANKKAGLAVERVETDTLKRTVVEQPKPDADLYISDQHGVIRIYAQQSRTGDGYLRGKRTYFYRADAKGRWETLSTYDTSTDEGFVPLTVDRDLNAAYGLEKVGGRDAVVRISLDGSLKREVILARPDVDVDELIHIGRQRRVVGVGYATERRHAVFFDPALKSLAAALSKVLPGQPDVRFVDASLDEKRLLVWAGSDVDPGRYYLYDKTTRQLRPLVENRPALTAVNLASMKAVTFKATDGADIPAYLTLPPSGLAKNLPAIVMPHGGPSARDEWGFDWLAQFYANRGYAVLQPNFRGSYGYGEAWFQQNGFQSWRVAIGDINDAARWLKSEGIAAPDKLAIVGWSYGGYAALQSQVAEPNLYKAVVAIAPVTDLDSLREEFREFTNFAMVDKFIGRGPHVKEGSPAQNADKIAAPVLMFHGDMDQNVEVDESRLMLSRLKGAGKKADLVVYPGLDHQLDDVKAREDMLSRSEAFLRQALDL